MKLLMFVGAACAVVLSCSAEAQTFAELQAAVNAAESGSTVYVENDMTFDAPLDVPDGKTITVEGRDGVVTLSRDTGYAAGTFFSAKDGARHLTLKNVVLDLKCEGTKVMLNGWVIYVACSASSFTLDWGAKICNAYQGGGNPGCMHARNGGLVRMNEGSEISHVYNNTYASAVLAGYGNDGIFVMNGGLITDCHATAGDTTALDWGGTVYVWKGRFFFNGGTITGNRSPYRNAGVVLDRGSDNATTAGVMYAGGHGVITGNVGKVSNDVYCCNALENIWIMNGAGDMPNATVMDGAVFTVKAAKENPALGGLCKCCTLRFKVNGTFAGVGCITAQDDPTLSCGNAFGEATSVYYPTWVKRAGVTTLSDGRTYARASLGELFDKTQVDAQHGQKATVAIAKDIVYEGTSARGFANQTDILLTSDGGRHTIKMPDRATYGFLSLLDGGDTLKKVRLENIVIDGNRDGGAYIPQSSNSAGNGLFRLERGATLELGPGATICNGKAESGGAGIRAVSLATVRMEEGAVISNMVAVWGSALLLGGGGETGSHTIFDMTGGLITDCHCSYEGTGNGNGAAVYLWHAIMNMSGGAIIGNDAPTGGTAGVHLETTSASQLNLSGTARICDNTGRDMDVFNRGCSISYSGDFRGLVGISVNSQSTNVGPADPDATGAWCFYRSSNDPAVDRTKWGYLVGDSVKWGEPVGTIDEYGFVQTSDIDIRLADAEDLSTAEARAKLPHVLSGAALNGNIAQTLTFDSEEMRDSGALPLCLYKFDDGAFAGSATFTTPTEGKLRWKVSQLTLADVSGLYLERDKPGLMILFR